MSIDVFTTFVVQPMRVDVSVEVDPADKFLVRPRLCHLFHDGPPAEFVLQMGLQGQALRDCLAIWYSESAMESGLPLNKAVAKLTEGRGSARRWAGLFLVVRWRGTKPHKLRDVIDHDVLHLREWFINW